MTSGSGSGGLTTRAPRSPPCTWACETWCEWYQYVPTWSATNR